MTDFYILRAKEPGSKKVLELMQRPASKASKFCAFTGAGFATIAKGVPKPMIPKEHYFVRAGVVGLTLLVLAVVAAKLAGDHRNPGTVARAAVEPAREPMPAAAPNPAAGPARPVQETPSVPLMAVASIAPLPANATAVPDEDLLKLAGMVNLAGARDHRPDKALWQQALPIAERLAQGPCDCEQRNWLNHFVEMGHNALSGSESDYYESANVMASLGRNDANAMAISHTQN